MRRALATALGAATALVAACSNNLGSSVSFAFNRPEHVAFTCLAPYTANPNQYTVLPRSCCAVRDPSAYPLDLSQAASLVPPRAPECTTVGDLPVGSAAPHALVTQSTRGEVAAVDLVKNRVLDSDRQVPGFTFVDSGGFPSAIVAPAKQPKWDGAPRGPAFVYVASAEDEQIRAIPTCRFRSSAACGPSLLNPELEQRLRVPLPAAPQDMLLGPDQALWVTLPSLGKIARIELPETPADGAREAFATELRDNVVQVAPPQLFGVSLANDVVPVEPVAESAAYAASCGLGSAYTASSVLLPLAPRVPPTNAVEPQQLRYDQETGLLLVSDRVAPVLHVFRLGDDGTLRELGALPTGQILREFVLTPRVPSLATADLLALTAPPGDDSTETQRYLYAIDDHGTVAVFDFALAADGGLPTLTPLLVPAPALLPIPRYADRIDTPAPAQTLEVIDTRTMSPYQCGEESIDQLKAQRDEINRLPKPLNAAQEDWRDRVNARIAVYETAGSRYLRGVFVVVASTSGTLSVIDVHDIDVLCRAQKFCCPAASGPSGPNGIPEGCDASKLTQGRSSDTVEALAVRRHTIRRRTAGKQTAEVASTAVLASIQCDASDPHASVQLTGQVCAPSDPWSTINETWRVDYEGTLPNSLMPFAHFETTDQDGRPLPDDRLRLIPPGGEDLCAVGAETDDLVAVVGLAKEALRGSCLAPSTENAPTFVIEQLRSDGAVVRARPAAGETPAELRARILRCYPDFARVELRAGGHVVLGSTGSMLHRMTRDADGNCVVDESKDPLLDARPRVRPVQLDSGTTVDARVFQNPYVRFALAPTPEGVDEASRETTVLVSRGSTGLQLTTVISGDSVSDALPSTLHYLPDMGYLFLLDTAGQGLRRYALRPFERESAVFR